MCDCGTNLSYLHYIILTNPFLTQKHTLTMLFKNNTKINEPTSWILKAIIDASK